MNKIIKLDEGFYKVLDAEDELGVVVRAHIHIEASIRQYVASKVKFPDQLPKLQYSQILKLACALGLDEEYFKALWNIGEIRNQFGHKLDMEISNEQMNKLYGLLPDHGKDQIENIFESLKRKGFEGLSPFLDIPARSKFNIMAILLKSIVVSSASMAKN